MANQEHLDKLKEGVEAWNQWREDNQSSFAYFVDPEFKGAKVFADNFNMIDLRYADLSHTILYRANLIGVDLHRANLSDAQLYQAQLKDAYLKDADLSSANLRKANLSGANLNGVQLNGAHLENADLSSANLGLANLSGAKISNANLSRVTLWGTVLAKIDLRTTKGLLEIRHIGPSDIELHSVQLPQDGSALHFLREAGIPDEWIRFYQATMQHPIQYHSCFISYSSDDYEIAKRLHADLQDQGVRCWFAPHDLVPGDYFREKIDQAIHMQDKLLLILSTHSMNSAWVQHEVRKALNREVNQNRTILFPISLDSSVFKSPSAWAQALREERHIGDFTQWETYEIYKQKFQTLLKQLKATEVKQ